MKRLRWILENNPLGSRLTGGDSWVAESGDTIVGHYAKIRYTMRYLGQDCLGTQGSHLATHPEFRRQGVASDLVEHAREDSTSLGVKMSFNFPNFPSSVLASKKRVLYPGTSRKLHLVLDRRQYLQKRFGGSTARVIGFLGFFPSKKLGQFRAEDPRGNEAEVVAGIRDNAGRVWEAVKSRFDLGIIRSTEYLRWRYCGGWGSYTTISLVSQGETKGYVVAAMSGEGNSRRMTLCELLAKDEDEATYEALGSVIIAEAKRQGATYISTYSSPLPGCRMELQKLGFVSTSFGFFFGNPGVSPAMYLFEGNADSSLRRSAYYYTPGDADFV